MKIKSLFYRNNYQGWEFETSFQDFNLLVGISGSGKSQILNAILTLKNIASGTAMNGIEWQIHFETDNKTAYIWKGAFQTYLTFYHQKEFEIKQESLGQVGNSRLIERLRNGRIKDNEQLDEAKLDKSKSILMLFKEDDFVRKAVECFDKIIFRDYTKSQQDRELSFYKFYYSRKKYDNIQTFEDLQKLNIPIAEKLVPVTRKKMSVLEDIKNRLKAIFPEITDWAVYLSNDDNQDSMGPKGSIQYRIKVADNPKWIRHNYISSGMLRTINHLVEIYLCNDNTVFLIDEFENSLGTNCIDVLAEDLLAESMRLQFIITSHHPYIINNIPMENWLVLSRHTSRIFVHKASELGLGISRHEHYLQLINSPIYNNIQ